ncbi:hypothetical protein [[Pseudomonas] boreopolis]|uniref:hypothetical protein n=1 Tax=Xanthomonas boreopolis TaxID=86183 RepID=UPI003D9BC45D
MISIAVIPAKAGSASQQPKRFTTAEWLVMADHPGTLLLAFGAFGDKGQGFRLWRVTFLCLCTRAAGAAPHGEAARRARHKDVPRKEK